MTYSPANTIWVLLGAALVFFMQAGFAMCEAGFTRAKNTGNILMKNLMDFCIGTPLYWLFGFGIMFGTGTALFGWIDPFIMGDYSAALPEGVPLWAYAIFQTVFCATSATIVSGAMAERTKFSAYCVYSAAISLFIYPVSGHWIWGGGWLAELGFHDFAGSTAVHMVGGVCALIGAKMLGPRIGKYGKDGKPRAIIGHNLSIAALGVFILWFCWFGFNGASTVGMDSDGLIESASLVFFNTNLAAALATLEVGFIAGLALNKNTMMAVCLGLITLLVFLVYLYIVVAGIASYDRELREKSGYLVFMVPVRPIDAIRAGSAEGVKLIIGTNMHEGTMFVYPENTGFPNSWAMIAEMLEKNRHANAIPEVVGFYHPSASDSFTLFQSEIKAETEELGVPKVAGDIRQIGGDPFIRFATDYAFEMPAIKVAKAQKQYTDDVWMYRYELITKSGEATGWKATHAAELPAMFDCPDHEFSHFIYDGEPEELFKKMVNDIHGDWVRFAKTGEPDPEWDRFEGDKSPVRIFDRETRTEILDRRHLMQIWDDMRFYEL